MSDVEKPPPEDADRPVVEHELDPEAPTDRPEKDALHADADRLVDTPDDADEQLQAENAGTSLDQPSDQTS